MMVILELERANERVLLLELAAALGLVVVRARVVGGEAVGRTVAGAAPAREGDQAELAVADGAVAIRHGG